MSESVLVPGQRPLAYFVQLTALALPLGALLGTAVSLLLVTGKRVASLHRALLPIVVWPVVGIGSGLGLAAALGSFNRLGSYYDSMAKLTLAGCSAGGALLGLLIASLVPTATQTQGLLPSAHPYVRACAILGFVAAAAGLGYADHTLYVGLYIPAHIALRVCSALLLITALAISASELALPTLDKRKAAGIGLLALVPLVTLDEHDGDVIQALVIRPWPATVLRVARSMVDLDRDGFSYLLGGGDCNDLNPRIHPGAREIPGNGIDDNCLFGDREVVVRVAKPPPIPKDPAPMSVVLITLDTLRADRLGRTDPAFGPKGRNTMPNLERWSHGGVVFSNAFTSGAWTSIAIGTMMRGMHARRMRWTRYYETTSYRLVKSPLEHRLAPQEQPAKIFPLSYEDPNPPLAHWLKRRGMRTFAVVDDGFSQMLSSSLGIARGFDVYREVNVEPVTIEEVERERKVGRRTTRDDDTTASFALAELRRYAQKKEPFFYWVHFFGAHTPSRSHPGVPSYGKRQQDLYDHEVRFVDSQVERVLAEVRKLDRKVAVIVTSDHGEAFFSRYRSHGADMSDDVLAIPMVMQVPGWKPQVIDTPVSLVDVMPTILGLTKTPAPSNLDGIDLARLVRGERMPERVLLSDTWQYGNDSKPFSELVAAFDGKHKVVLDRIDHSFSVYDQTDPKAPPLRIEGLANGKLARSVLGYLEDTGGQLDMVDGEPAKPPQPRKEAPKAPTKAKPPTKPKATAPAAPLTPLTKESKQPKANAQGDAPKSAAPPPQ